MSLGGPKDPSMNVIKDAMRQKILVLLYVSRLPMRPKIQTMWLRTIWESLWYMIQTQVTMVLLIKVLLGFQYGTAVDIAAPGTSIYSTYPGGSYEYLDGTNIPT